ncbi:hypothetical protein [Nitrospirillum viridazoti]|uniref:Alpha-L-glutamate ligase n=1 Tax=Nitrospirillum viridazoti CBAmc TaxID=1441467 RepID=A0A248K2S7_9PROT|nr:hypothetical protein [Nitrospirillum amazonense]ASG25031.1 hypothetical protein Y958_29095 [Nitrospirillum amazonense CBAmc]TWB31215.1 hypothetical protein FBZ91_12023 [Nitrospirillum amazonense]
MEKLGNLLVYEWNSWRGYLISHLAGAHCAAQWDDDWTVLEAACGPGIDTVLFHHCLSHAALFPRQRPAFERELARRGIRVLNAGLADMRKRTLHGMLDRAGLRSARAARQGPDDQFLFIKTDLNYGGKAERALPAELQPLFSAAADCPIRGWDDYRLMRRDEVEPGWWDNPDLVIENFIAHDDTLYRVYGCGDALVCIRAHSPDLIKKEDERPEDTWVYIDRRQLTPAIGDHGGFPRDLWRQLAGFVAQYPFDYFCLDVIHDGIRHTIIDLNLTPFYAPHPPKAGWFAFLRRGLRELTAGRPTLMEVAR